MGSYKRSAENSKPARRQMNDKEKFWIAIPSAIEHGKNLLIWKLNGTRNLSTIGVSWRAFGRNVSSCDLKPFDTS